MSLLWWLLISFAIRDVFQRSCKGLALPSVELLSNWYFFLILLHEIVVQAQRKRLILLWRLVIFNHAGLLSPAEVSKTHVLIFRNSITPTTWKETAFVWGMMIAFTFSWIVHWKFELIYEISLYIFAYYVFLLLLPKLWNTSCTRKLIPLRTFLPTTHHCPISFLLLNDFQTIYSMIQNLFGTAYKYIIPSLLLSMLLLPFWISYIHITGVLINDQLLQSLDLLLHLRHQTILPLYLILHFIHLPLIYSFLII